MQIYWQVILMIVRVTRSGHGIITEVRFPEALCNVPVSKMENTVLLFPLAGIINVLAHLNDTVSCSFNECINSIIYLRSEIKASHMKNSTFFIRPSPATALASNKTLGQAACVWFLEIALSGKSICACVCPPTRL